MKTIKLLSLTLLLITGCATLPAKDPKIGRGLDVGDCFVVDDEIEGLIKYKVMKVGKYSYLVMGFDGEIKVAKPDLRAQKADCWTLDFVQPRS